MTRLSSNERASGDNRSFLVVCMAGMPIDMTASIDEPAKISTRMISTEYKSMIFPSTSTMTIKLMEPQALILP